VTTFAAVIEVRTQRMTLADAAKVPVAVRAVDVDRVPVVAEVRVAVRVQAAAVATGAIDTATDPGRPVEVEAARRESV
jgi:hypothetical protein